MQIKRCAPAMAAVVAMMVLGGCGSSDPDSTSGRDSAVTTSQSVAPSSAPGPAAVAEHNQADVMFVQGMIPHHEQAVTMSDTIMGKPGIAPEVVSLAKEIKTAQAPEITQMQGWLKEWGAQPGMGDMSAMPGHDMPGHGSMPGMAGGMMSEQDMADLQNAEGVAASRLFLTQMIEHHEGAITMAQNEINAGEFPAAVEMARAIVTSQQDEINTMKQLLQTL
jgi:uncharacterized protein (DUF305 family)